MRKEEEKIDFDLSLLQLNELIEAYRDINDFLNFLEEEKQEIEDEEMV